MGVKGAEQLIKLIEGKKIEKKNIILEPELIIRETTK
jgi:DNA-binding LacI/PurR family transcriptional regulator